MGGPVQQQRVTFTWRYLRQFLLFSAVVGRNVVYVGIWAAQRRLKAKQVTPGHVLVWSGSDPPPHDLDRSTPNHPPFVVRVRGPVVVEPKYGFVIDARGVLWETSVSNSNWVKDPKRTHFFGFPSPGHAVRRVRAESRMDHDTAVVIGAAWQDNYFHFFSDVLPKIALMAGAVDPRVPVLVHPALYDRSFFRELKDLGDLADYHFVRLPERRVTCGEVVFGQLPYFSHDVSRFRDGMRLVGLGTGEATPHRRIFLTRHPRRGRVLTNLAEIEPILKRHGFDQVDTEDLTVVQQAETFRAARYVVGIHGAGLVNVQFAQGCRLDLVELLPPGMQRGGVYERMCAGFGFGYAALNGTPDSPRVHWGDSFAIDVEGLDSTLEQVVDRT